MTQAAPTVRPERAEDVERASTVHAHAFARPGQPSGEPVEVGLVDALRAASDVIAELTFVASIDGVVVGHVLCSRATLLPDRRVVALGPIGVEPELQRRGIGSALVHEVLETADARGEPLVALLGSPAYYGRFGFVASTTVGIRAPDPTWGTHFQVKTLSSFDATTRGDFRYAPGFDAV